MSHRQACELPTIAAVSPSLAETLRICPLQAGISKIRTVGKYVLGNPKAWLGTAYHKVLEQVMRSAPPVSEIKAEELWAEAISKLQLRAQAHPLNRRFSNPEQWPGYHLVHAFAMLRAKQAVPEQPRELVEPLPINRVFREQEFSAMGGKLIGKPDVIAGDDILDYKSGRIHDETPGGDPAVKQAYVRQLRLYGQLVAENLGWWPSRGVLLPMDGEDVEVPLDSEACAAEAAEAVQLLERYNEQVQRSSTVANLAMPCPSACRWCPYKALCPPFWAKVDGTWIEGLKYACVRGALTSAPRGIHNDKAVSITLASSAGTTTGLLTIAPLETSIHDTVASWQAGDVVCVMNLYRRNDGQLAPTPTTLCARDVDSIALPAA